MSCVFGLQRTIGTFCGGGPFVPPHELACSQGPFVPLGLELLRVCRGTICSFAAEGPFVPLSRTLRQGGRRACLARHNHSRRDPRKESRTNSPGSLLHGRSGGRQRVSGVATRWVLPLRAGRVLTFHVRPPQRPSHKNHVTRTRLEAAGRALHHIPVQPHVNTAARSRNRTQGFIHSFIPSFLHPFIPSFLHFFIPSVPHHTESAARRVLGGT